MSYLKYCESIGVVTAQEMVDQGSYTFTARHQQS